ncbi:Asp-tRNA(Asn)/Glu-tRNA(Gln) amidotransferase subunit GatA [Campylobacter fetus]|uniref:Asp-tRNA(Asn)/Glu-tRNA(Gln) amidotransferase subunit GatA n=1 Tax=Campylobacter fetus TaxID=196 RepID=UPI00127F64C5|nr:Asp-tRNA(Asn)/Glu-tRNA(Gln) amidotransferase subunit GatA [Campylobacter fetus]EAI5647708.1 Asp-tRNA(Asn)/Glu-tRNA(Gln) amidotransferase subunit GatA [Campylobacter fetus]EAI5945691.1 Asp-tRNA(Asn)/Glu-tRNA(Gln) amidotransferase subunit GatA [Campylobacter fetus]EAJ0319980.1 Asp-tRNA(Asn)/Glu-tRNA(Gln) amidotransferase subunit GatA [Campylobacter fetus]EAJ0344519.1 Asp-tRNA(Asn)/Glu-tRNA(Gln) amidotransferase subunit GatA [Campylobacter fetus]EAJ1238433.1 Asp-tRNA(Asn)/Glu-tRNA(Gln) amidotr
MISLKDAIKLSSSDIVKLRKNLKDKIKDNRQLGAYIEQLTNSDISDEYAGVPIAIKDNIQVKNWSITSCSKILQGYVAPYHATVVEKLLKAGLAPFGRTNMDEFAMGSTTESSFYGKTLNPLDHTRVPGGSSGGSAAAVSAGLAIAALGSDTGGSIRQPAAFCGCVGFKPTYGRVSRYGLGAYSSSLDQIGPITRSVEDAALLYDMIAGHDPKDSTSSNLENISTSDKLNSDRKLTIAVIKNYVDGASQDVKDSLYKVVDKLKEAGHNIIYKDLSNSKYDIAAYYIIATAEASANLSRYDGVRYGRRADSNSLGQMYSKTRGEGFGVEVQRRMLLGTFVLSSGYYDAYYIKAQKARAFIKLEYEEILNEADIMLMPVAPSVAYKFGELSDPLSAYLSDIYTIGVNLAGLPAITVPVQSDKNGLNISAQLIGGAWKEQDVLDAAFGLEKLVKGN